MVGEAVLNINQFSGGPFLTCNAAVTMYNTVHICHTRSPYASPCMHDDESIKKTITSLHTFSCVALFVLTQKKMVQTKMWCGGIRITALLPSLIMHQI